MLFAFAIYVNAQTTPVSNYVFLQDEEGTYSEISGGTVHGTITNDDESFNAINIGFTFNYNGVDYTQISIQTNGFIAMGNSVNVIEDEPISDVAGSNNIISGFGNRLRSKSDGELMTKIEGAAPNRIFTIQWKNYMRDLDDCDEDIINFQIKLYETSNKIEFVYGVFFINNIAGYSWLMPEIGLRGNSNADFNNRKSYFNHIRYKWENSIVGTSNSDNIAFIKGFLPQSGLTFTYDAPASLDIGIADLTSPERVFYSVGNQNIEVAMKNFGTTTITSATIKWKINDGTTNTYDWSGSLTQASTAENINIGNYDFTGEGFYDIEIWTENPNGSADANPENDNLISFHTLNLYCSSNIVYDEWWYIEDVIIGNIIHIECGAYDTYSIADYSTHLNAEYTPGSNLNYSIDVNSGGWVAFWLDLNDDNNYDETEYLGTSENFAYNETATGVLTLPEDAAEGTHKLRVRYIYTTEPGAANACTPLSELGYDGDAHEYAITIYNPSTPPPCAFNPTPTNTTTDVVLNEVLEWESEAATSFDVYFGTDATPPFIRNQEDNFYGLGGLEEYTTYYWKIIAKNEFGSATDCETWSFTTGEDIEYCIPGFSDCDEWGDQIDDFYMDDLIHENSGCSPAGYGIFTDGTYTTDLIQGANVQWSADYGSQDALAIWIDFNDDGIFNETDEFVYHTELEDGNFVHIEEGQFIIPIESPLGVHRMRIRCAFDFNEFQGSQACASVGSGETHDYIITVIEPTEPPDCATTPFPENSSTDQYLNADLSWVASQASSFDVYLGTTELVFIEEVTESYFDPGTLEANTEYQWKIIPKNTAGSATGCDIWTFTTGEDLEYCTSSLYYGDIMNDPCEWGDVINDFTIGDLNHTGSGCDGGYDVADFTSMSVDLAQGSNYTWTANIGNDNDYFAIWLDTNNDGTFDATECLYTAPEGGLPANCNGTIIIPGAASLGEHRLRIRVTFRGPILPEQACTQFQYGEAHDYTVNVIEPTQAPDCAINPSPANNATEIILNYGEISWQADFASEFDVYFGTETEPPLVSESQTFTSFNPGLFEANTTYYWKIIPSNMLGGPDDCEVWSFSTAEELVFCTNLYQTGMDYNCQDGDNINDFSIANFEHLGTGCTDETGQAVDYTDMTIDLERGNTYTYTVTNNHAGWNHFAVWIDYNNDGEFNNSNEFIYTSEDLIPASYTDTLFIDELAEIGEHRMRLRIKSSQPSMTGDDACTWYYFGETHDYTVNITGIVNIDKISENINIYPNPATNFVNIEAESNIKTISIYNSTGQIVSNSKFQNFKTSKIEVNTSDLTIGFYIIRIETQNGIYHKNIIIQ